MKPIIQSLTLLGLLLTLQFSAAPANGQESAKVDHSKPNILVIWGDDVGQSVFRTGLSKVGMPGAKEGMQIEDPTIAGTKPPFGTHGKVLVEVLGS